jgi:hypothetical protein
MGARDDLSRREIGLLVLGATALALAMHWPLPLHIGDEVPKDLGDPMGQAWQLAWIGHAPLHQPGDLFQANIWWPIKNSLAATDILFGYAPVALIGSGPDAAVIKYDLLFLFAYALAFIGAYLLARELGVGRAGSAVAGAAFAYAPWRLGHDPHLNLLSSGGIPLSLFLLLRGYRRNAPGTVLAGWLVATWQLLLGIGLGIQLVYLLLMLAVIALVYLYRRRPPLRRGVIVATGIGVAALVLSTAWLARPYLDLREQHPEAGRTLNSVWEFSPDTGSFFRTPPGNLVWGGPPRGHEETIQDHEFALFPGIAIVLLAIVGCLVPVYPKRRRLLFALAVIGLMWLSLGWRPGRVIPLQPYKLVFEYLPGWDGIRVPSRLNTLTSLGLALLAAAGAHQIVARTRGWAGSRSARWRTVAPAAVAVVLVSLVLLEGSGFQLRDGGLRAPERAEVPSVPTGQRGAPDPQLHLPFAYGRAIEPTQVYMLWSTDGFPKMANGWGAFIPDQDLELHHETKSFPDPLSVSRLRALGIRTVILHPDRVANSEWKDVADRPVKGLPLRREVRDGVILYHLKPI